MPPLLWGARLITVAAAIAAVCVIAAVAVSASNQTLRQEISERQQGINQGLLSQINTRLANALALLAARDDDARIRSFLAQHGITVNLNPAPPSATQLTGTK